jgi:hypothetical protein
MLPMNYQEWCDTCTDHPLLLEPIYAAQALLRQRLGGDAMWFTMTNHKELSPTQTSAHYLSHLRSLYDEALLKYTLTSRLNALTQMGDSRRLFSSNSGLASSVPRDTDSDEDYPVTLLRVKPVSRSSSTSSLQSMIIVSDCSTPFSTAGIVLHDRRYDTDGDTISVASGVSAGRDSDFGQYEEEGEAEGATARGGWYRGQSGDGDENDLLSPRSVLSDSGDEEDEETEEGPEA